MLLSLSSAAAEVESDLTSINGTISASDGIPAGQELLNFTDSVHRLDDSLEPHRVALVETIGEEGMIDAAVISSVFRSLNITADSSGIRIDDDWESAAAGFATQTGAQTYRTLENSPKVKSILGGEA
tara:strand:- start:120 stop:500 length:381 start_codon:yes stop_codon:yes gene_type:complete